MEKQQPSKAALLSIIPGLGQIYNKQKAKGFIFLGVTIVFVLYFLALATPELSNLITLGDKPGRDNSLFMLIRGAFHLIFVIVYVLFYFSNIKDAHTIAKRINNGIPVPRTLKDMIKGIYENGFPYLLIIPSYVAMTFAIIFPVIVTLMIAFTNYDFQHLPPNKLLDWVGLTNFTNIWSLSTFRSAFGSVLSWTIIWALAASTLQIVIGIFTAIIANQPFIKGKRIFGVIFLYEAAYIDGANAWQKFRNITFPMILAVAAPTLISQYTFNFNNFSIMYLFNGGGPGSVGGGAGSTDILISWIYRLTTGTSPQYSMAAAVTLIISIIVISISMIAFKKLHAFDMEDV